MMRRVVLAALALGYPLATFAQDGQIIKIVSSLPRTGSVKG